MTRPMSLTARRHKLNTARDKAEADATRKIAKLLHARYNAVKRQVGGSAYQRRNIGKRLAAGEALLKADDDQNWTDWIDAFTAALWGILSDVVEAVWGVEADYWRSYGASPNHVDARDVIAAYERRTGKQIRRIAEDTKRDVLNNIIAWHNSPAGIRELIDALGQYFDETRAETIARTEAAFITAQVNDNLFRQFDIGFYNVDLGNEVNGYPCDECRAQADANPHSMDETNRPPFHPRCRCSVIPANSDGTVFIFGQNSADT